MTNKFLLEAVLKPFNISELKRKEIAVKLDLPSNNQKDLMFMSAILVSTGVNANGAHFLGSELIKARSSITQKALDIEHVEHKIIGHIASSMYMDFDGNILDDEKLLSELASTEESKRNEVISKLDSMNMDVGIVCVVYKDRFPQIAEELEQGEEWKVSMECYYKDYDLKIGKMILPKNLSNSPKAICTDLKLTAEIESVLKGDVLGTSDVSRILRDISFCGVGIVKNPANKRSIILEAASSGNLFEEEKIAASSVIEQLKNIDKPNYVVQTPMKGWGITKDKKEILYFSASDGFETILDKALELTVKTNEPHMVVSFNSQLKSEDSVELQKNKTVYYKVDREGNIIKMIPFEDKIMEEKVDEVKASIEKEEAILKTKKGYSVPENIDSIKFSVPTPEPIDVSNVSIPLYEILDILWGQVFPDKVSVKDIIDNNRSETYSDPVDNRRNFRGSAYALASKKLFLMDSKESVNKAATVFKYAISKLNEEEKVEFFNNLITASIIHNIDSVELEKYFEQHGLHIENIKEFSSEFAIPRLLLLPLSSREQVIAAMSRCMHMKVSLTDKEKEYMVVNILRAAQKFNIDSLNFKERVKRLNF